MSTVPRACGSAADEELAAVCACAVPLESLQAESSTAAAGTATSDARTDLRGRWRVMRITCFWFNGAASGRSEASLDARYGKSFPNPIALVEGIVHDNANYGVKPVTFWFRSPIDRAWQGRCATLHPQFRRPAYRAFPSRCRTAGEA